MCINEYTYGTFKHIFNTGLFIGMLNGDDSFYELGYYTCFIKSELNIQSICCIRFFRSLGSTAVHWQCFGRRIAV